MKSANKMFTLTPTVLLLLFCCQCWGQAALPQDDGPQTKSIPSDAFRKNRPAGPHAARKPPPKRTFSYSGTVRRFPKQNAEPPVATANANAGKQTNGGKKNAGKNGKKTTDVASGVAGIKFTELGLTMWRLRPPAEGEPGVRFQVEGAKDGDEDQYWIAERTAGTTGFRLGDRVRLAIEASDTGYLYIANRETCAGGAVMPAHGIFPELPDDYNQVGPGILFDIPDQRESYPYLDLQLRDGACSDYNGELLTIIISQKRLSWFERHQDGVLKGVLKDVKPLEALEKDAESYVLDRTDKDDKVYTRPETEPVCGPVTRGLDRTKKAAKPCGTRQLTANDPDPGTLIRTKVTPGQPIVAFVRIPVKR